LGEIEKGQLVKTKLRCNAQNKDAGKAILVEFSYHLKKRVHPAGVLSGRRFLKSLMSKRNNLTNNYHGEY
jgi:hypothetical protein